MVDVAATALLAPLLVGAATLAARRWGPRVGGVVSAFPAIVGPVLVIDLLAHDAAFTARAAGGTLLGLVALSAFVAVYGRPGAPRGMARERPGRVGAAAVVAARLSGRRARTGRCRLQAAAASLLLPAGLGAAAFLGHRARSSRPGPAARGPRAARWGPRPVLVVVLA
jgi:hypothetical protein